MKHSSVNREELLTLFDWQQRREVEYYGLVREVDTGVVRAVPAPGHKGEGCVLWSDLAESDVDSAIQRELARFKALGQGFEWKAYAHDAPGNLVEDG